MVTFTKKIKCNSGYCEFTFKKIPLSIGSRYQVSVADTHGKLFSFNMKEESGKWLIINYPKLPDWIIEQEKVLSNQIFIEESIRHIS